MANLSGYNFAYLDEQTKRMIRRAILKAVAIPGYQVPFGGREMPMPYGWGTGGIQLTASVIGESDVLKVIDQGADDTTNAVSIRNFFKRVTGVNTTERTDDATLIQTRHRIPETPLTEDQIIIFQVPIPEPLRFIEPRETETRTMHALEEYGVMQVKLYERRKPHVCLLRYRLLPPTERGKKPMNQPLLSVNNLTHLYAPGKGFSDVSFDLWPGEVLGIVGESGSGKTTLLKSISARLTPQQGEIRYENRSLYGMSEADRRRLLRTEWGVVHQHPLDGLRRQVSAGGNIGERLMATGARHYGDIRATAQKWLEEVEIPANRIDDLPTTFSGGMQQRLQIARNLVTHPKLVFMDEPTGGLDVSVQARLLDLLRGLVVELNLAVVIVTHDLGVARLLADRLLVMKQGQVVESGLTDRVLDDPHHPYTQLLVSSVLQN